jgi:hypothetical protein
MSKRKKKKFYAANLVRSVGYGGLDALFFYHFLGGKHGKTTNAKTLPTIGAGVTGTVLDHFFPAGKTGVVPYLGLHVVSTLVWIIVLNAMNQAATSPDELAALPGAVVQILPNGTTELVR